MGSLFFVYLLYKSIRNTMKLRAYLFTFIVTALMILASGCDKPDYYKPGTRIDVTSYRVTSEISGGYAGGETAFGSGGIAANGVNFLSQYPLKDFIYEQNVTYDSIVRYTVDEQSGDTISSFIDIEIVGRDTIGFYTDSKWLPFDYWGTPHLLNLYIGVSSIEALGVGVQLTIYPTGNVAATHDLAVFMPDSLTLVERLGIIGGLNLDRHDFIVDGPLALEEGKHYVVKPDVPIYDEQGLVTGTQLGIEISPIAFFQQVVVAEGDVVPVIRPFIVSVEVGGEKITTSFSIRFVEQQTYLDRQCWLTQEFECKDLF